MAPGRVILDVGCSTGGVLRPRVKTHEVHGVEIAPGFVKRAIENGIHAVQHNIESEPLPYPAENSTPFFAARPLNNRWTRIG
jgi:cyclopropane fatty-acyl-phospholipid synthase-like methyltransferase